MIINAVEITLETIGERIDKALAVAHPEYSRAQWQRLIKDGQVLLQGKPVKSSFVIAKREVVAAVLPEIVEAEIVAEAIPLDIRYEDEDLILINKPAGMVVHPAAGHDSGTLVNAVLAHCPDLAGVGGEKRPGIVHRLDKDTSGLILVAKNDKAMRFLQAQFRKRTIGKKYVALVDGVINPSSALIDAPLGRDPRNRKRMSVIAPSAGGGRRSARGRESQTEYHTLRVFEEFTLLDCLLYTGRTHQIRVHLAYVGFPIVGDSVYGRRKQNMTIKLKRHFLHAAELRFKRPSDGEELTFTAELPPELQKVLDSLE